MQCLLIVIFLTSSQNEVEVRIGNQQQCYIVTLLQLISFYSHHKLYKLEVKMTHRLHSLTHRLYEMEPWLNQHKTIIKK